MNVEYNYQTHPHQWKHRQVFDFVFWGSLIAIAFLVGFGVVPWWVFLIVIAPNFLNLSISRSWSVTSTIDMGEEEAKKELKRLKRDPW